MLERTNFLPIASFINGLTFSVLIYCIVFLELAGIYGLVLIVVGIGLILLIPYFLLGQIVWKTLIRPTHHIARLSFILAIIFSAIIAGFSGKMYADGIRNIERFIESDYHELEKSFMVEKIIGMHFTYHTRFCEFDGWRPPKHEPLLILGMWFNNRKDPLDVGLKYRIALYQRFFPHKPVKFSCSCAIQYSDNYHNDDLWNQLEIKKGSR